MPTNEATLAAAAVEVIGAKLDRVIAALINGRRGEQVPFPPEIQWAMRILASRKRAWQREWNAQYCTDPLVMERAKQEMAMASQDEGDLLFFAGGKHGVGRLDCTACDFDYIDFHGMPVQKPLCKVCPECHAGVLHVKTIGEWPEGAVVDPISKTSEVKPDMYCRTQCDNCGSGSKERVTDGDA